MIFSSFNLLHVFLIYTQSNLLLSVENRVVPKKGVGHYRCRVGHYRCRSLIRKMLSVKT